jgi:hypothetical protein
MAEAVDEYLALEVKNSSLHDQSSITTFSSLSLRDFCDLARPDAVQECETSRCERLKGSFDWRVIRERPQAPRLQDDGQR